MFNSLKKGNVLKNPEFWKDVQNKVNLIFGLSGILAFAYPEIVNILSADNLISITTGITAINVYLTTATTPKIGL